MHKTGVILLAVGGVILLIGVIALVVGFMSTKDLLEKIRPDTHSVWSGRSADGAQKKKFDASKTYAVWVEGTTKPTFKAVDPEGADAFRLTSLEQTVAVNERSFQKLGDVDVQAGTEYTLSVEGEGTVYIAEPISDEEAKSVVGGMAGGFGIGCCGTGLGGILAILGLILGLVLKKKAAQPPVQ